MIQAIAWVTFLEGIRNKAVYGITLMAGLMMAFTVVLSGMIMRDVGKVASDFALSTATFAALLVVLFRHHNPGSRYGAQDGLSGSVSCCATLPLSAGALLRPLVAAGFHHAAAAGCIFGNTAVG